MRGHQPTRKGSGHEDLEDCVSERLLAVVVSWAVDPPAMSHARGIEADGPDRVLDHPIRDRRGTARGHDQDPARTYVEQITIAKDLKIVGSGAESTRMAPPAVLAPRRVNPRPGRTVIVEIFKRSALCKGIAHRVDLLLDRVDTHAEDQPPAAQHVERRRRLGQPHGVVVRQHEHGRPQADARGARRHEAQQRQRLVVRAPADPVEHLPGVEHVVVHPRNRARAPPRAPPARRAPAGRRSPSC
jgi:hypothetical protein